MTNIKVGDKVRKTTGEIATVIDIEPDGTIAELDDGHFAKVRVLELVEETSRLEALEKRIEALEGEDKQVKDCINIVNDDEIKTQ